MLYLYFYILIQVASVLGQTIIQYQYSLGNTDYTVLLDDLDALRGGMAGALGQDVSDVALSASDLSAGSDGAANLQFSITSQDTTFATLSDPSFGESVLAEWAQYPDLAADICHILGTCAEGTGTIQVTLPAASSDLSPYSDDLLNSMKTVLGTDEVTVQLLDNIDLASSSYTTIATFTVPAQYASFSQEHFDDFIREMAEVDGLNTLTGSVTETIMSLSTSLDVASQYESELMAAMAFALNTIESDVMSLTFVELVPGFPQINLVYQIKSVSTVSSALANQAQYEINFQSELADISGLNVALGLASTSMTVTLSDVSITGFNMTLDILNAVSSHGVSWGVTPFGEEFPESLETGLCGGSMDQIEGVSSVYQPCYLVENGLYVFYFLLTDADGNSQETIPVQQTVAEVSSENVYPYKFGVDITQVILYKTDLEKAFAETIGVDPDASLVFGNIEFDSSNSDITMVRFDYPYTTYTSTVVMSEDFEANYQAQMATYDTLSVFAEEAVEDIELDPYYSYGTYTNGYSSAAEAEVACQGIGADYSLCTKDQLYTIVYVGVDGFQVPELCYSAWIEEGYAGWYHEDENTCGGFTGWQSWAPATPGAHCCSTFEAQVPVLDSYFYHPYGYYFETFVEAEAACQAMDEAYYICSKEQIEAIAHLDDDYNDPKMCISGWVQDGSEDGMVGYYIPSDESNCYWNQVGWITTYAEYGEDGQPIYGAHCCLPSYLDGRTEDLLYGSSVDDNGVSTFEAAKEFCSNYQYTPAICTKSQLKTIGQSENTNICLSGWVATDDSRTEGEVGWYQGDFTAGWCGDEGWNEFAADFPVAHCCAEYVQDYTPTSYEILPTSYADGFTSGDDAQAACQDAGYDDLCTQAQVVWWAENDEPNLCRSAWSQTSSGEYVIGWQGWEGCGSSGSWETWSPATPVAHCCMESVPDADISLDPYKKGENGYIHTNAIDAASECHALGDDYDLCTWNQLYRVAYGDDDWSDDNICYTGWVIDGKAGWWQKSTDTCGGIDGWRTWILDGLFAGAHCCLEFTGMAIPGVPSSAPTSGGATCSYRLMDGTNDLFDGVWVLDEPDSQGKNTYFKGSYTMVFDNEVWRVLTDEDVDLVSKTYNLAQSYPPEIDTWDFVEGTTVSATYEDVTLECTTDVLFVGGSITGVNDGDTVTVQLYDELVVLGSTTFNFVFYDTPLLVGDSYEVTIADTSLAYSVCSISSNTGVLVGDALDVVVECEYVTYTLGGTVTNLLGLIVFSNGAGNSEMKTIDNTNDAYTLANPGNNWVFSKEISYGASYDVSVDVHPNGQECHVNNGDGVVSGHVEDIEIVCVSDVFTISGQITGVESMDEPVVLKVGNQTLELSESGDFQFTESASYGTQYEVIVESTQDGYTCIPTNNMGTVTGAVEGILVTCIDAVGTTYTVQMHFTEVMDCLNANSISFSEWVFYDQNGDEISYDPFAIVSDPSASPAGEDLSNIYDGDTSTKWLDWNLKGCLDTVLVTGIALDTEPYSYNWATSNDEPNRDPKSWDMTICTLLNGETTTCKSLTYYVDDDNLARSAFLPEGFSLEGAYPIVVTVTGSDGEVVVENIGYGDTLTFGDTSLVSETQTFTYQISSGSTFDVQVISQPYGQDCFVTDGTGFATETSYILIECAAECVVPLWMDELYDLGFPIEVGVDICIKENEYHWQMNPLCVGGGTESATCDNKNMVCGGPLSITYGTVEAQKTLLQEVLQVTDTCIGVNEACVPYDDSQSCCNPYSTCMLFSSSISSTESFGYLFACVPNNECEVKLYGDDCGELVQPGGSLLHERCPSEQTCNDVEATWTPPYFDNVEYCLGDDDIIYMNGDSTCINVTANSVDEQNTALESLWWSDWDYKEDSCDAVSKSDATLTDDHYYQVETYTELYLDSTTNAAENCCLFETEVDAAANGWWPKINYIESIVEDYSGNAEFHTLLSNVIFTMSTLKSELDAIQL